MNEAKWTPARASSSTTIASYAKVPPPPPYSAGMSLSKRPTSPAFVHDSTSGRCCFRQQSCCGANSFWMKRRAVVRNSRSSSFIHEDSLVMIFRYDGGYKAGHGNETLHAPAAVLSGGVLDAKDSGRLIRRE